MGAVEAEVVALVRDVIAGVAVGAAVLVIGAVVLVTSLRRRSPREATAVSGYRRTLDTLGRVHESNPQRADRRFSARRPERSLAAMDRRSHRAGLVVLAGVVVLAAVGAVVYLGTRRTPTTAHHRQGAGAAHAATPTDSTTTSVPTRYSAVASTASSATFAPDQATYSVTIAATSNECWVSMTSSTGATLLEETLPAGASKSMSASGDTTVVLGAPTSAALSIGGVPAVLPAGVVGPFTVTLAPK